MRYKLLGRSGLRVSELCLGTMSFGTEWGWGADEAESRRIYEAFRAAGGNFVDTANLYTDGASERFLGRFTAGHRDEVVLATKYTLRAPGSDPNAAGNHRKSMMRAVDESLARLGTDYIDLYYLHIWDHLTPADEVIRGFEDLVRQGKVLYVGLSDVPAWQASRMQTIAELRGWAPVVALQIEYSLVERTVERELVPMADAIGMAVLPWGPLAAGVLTGRYLKAGEAGRLGGQELPERKRRIAEAVVRVAEQVGATPSQVALAWLRTRPGTVIPILGASKVAQLEDNLKCLGVTLADEHLRALDEASAIELGFPHDFYKGDRVRGFVYGGTRDKIDAPLP